MLTDKPSAMNPRRLGSEPLELAAFFGLLMECSLHGGNPRDCQLHNVRELPLHDRYEWAKGAELVDARRIKAACAECSRRQLAALRINVRQEFGG